MAEIREKIIERIRSLEELPVAGPAFLETQKLLGQAGGDAAGAVRIIEKDVGITAKILKTANSVYYSGRYGEIGDLRQAVTRLGMDEVCRISLAFKAMTIFPDYKSGILDIQEFWHHCIGTAMVTRSIAAESRKRNFDPGEAYVAGLLHDIGIIILDRYFGAIFRKVRETAETASENLRETERRLLDIDHGEIGGLILERWRFPESIVNAVSWHHDPDRARPESLGLTQLVHLADFACAAVGASEPGDAVPREASLGAWHDLDVDTGHLNRLVEETEEEIAKTKILLNLNE